MKYNNNEYDFSNIFKGKSNRLSSALTSESKDLLNELTSFYPIFNSKNDIKVRAYIIKNNYTSKDLLCKNCKKNYVKFNSPSKGFVQYCSPDCANNSSEFIASSKKTCLKKFGHEYSFSSKILQDKKKQTNFERYGHTNILCSEKFKKHIVEKYGYEYASQAPEIKDQVKQSNLEKYGYEYASQVPEIKDQVKQSNLEKIKNYKLLTKEYIENNFLDNKKGFLLNNFMAFYDMCQPSAHKYLKKLEVDYRKGGTSQVETEIIDFINDVNTIQGDRLLINKELDILVPGKFAIEYHGLMFHSHGISKYSIFNNPKEDRKRHVVKTDLCENKGVQLFQIFENEWITKQDIWKSVINSKLNNTNRIFGRKCEIFEVSAKEAREFENLNHLQGYGVSKIRYGLYYNGELVSLMTFGKARMSKKYEYELIRFCSKLNTTVVGGASKLLKHFERMIKPKSLVSYANRRWSTGNLYDTIGFTFSHISDPNYFYFKQNSNILESRNKYQKHKLSKILKIFNPNNTETQNMFDNGYRKIYDAGNIIYKKEYK